MMPNATIHIEPLLTTPDPPADTETAILAAPPDMTKLSQPTSNTPHFSSLPIIFSVEPIVKTYSVTPLTWILPKLCIHHCLPLNCQAQHMAQGSSIHALYCSPPPVCIK